MRYLAVKWHHNFIDEPYIIYSEIDEEFNEIRKIELFKDGKFYYATEKTEVGNTGLSLEPLPALDDINVDPQFEAKYITKEEFENLWKNYVLA